MVKQKKLIVKRRRGYIESIENPNVKNKKVVYLVQKGNFTGWTPVNSRGRVIKGLKRGRTEVTALTNALQKGHRKVVFRE